jgi:hypothetical protein
MRKGYGPTHASYHLPLERFTEMVRKGINIAQGVDENGKVLSSTLPQNLSENSI